MTSEGKPKVIGRYDCSGAGDVDTSTIVTATEGNILKGLSGRNLVVSYSRIFQFLSNNFCMFCFIDSKYMEKSIW